MRWCFGFLEFNGLVELFDGIFEPPLIEKQFTAEIKYVVEQLLLEIGGKRTY